MKNEKTLIKTLFSFLLIGFLLIGLYYLYKYLGLDRFESKEEFQAYIASFGSIGPILFILAAFLQVSFIPIPGAFVIIGGTFLFGKWLCFLYCYIGMMLGSILAFYLGRLLGKPFVNWLAGDESKVDALLKKIKTKQNVVLFFMFLLPFFPDDLLCSVCGILTMRFPSFLLMQIITRATSILATILFMSGEFIPYSGWGIPILILLGIMAIIAFILSYKYSEKIEKWFMSILNKFNFKKKE